MPEGPARTVGEAVRRASPPYDHRMELVNEFTVNAGIESCDLVVETVRALVFDGLDREDVAALERLAGHVVQQIEAAGLRTVS